MGLANIKKKEEAQGKKSKSNILKVNKYEDPQMALNLIAHIMTSATDTAVYDDFSPFDNYSDNLLDKFYDGLMKNEELVEAANGASIDFIITNAKTLRNDYLYGLAFGMPTEIERTNGKPSRTIAVGGGFSSGKSSFLNSITGIGTVLPTGIEPVSMINTYLNCSNNTNKLIVKGRNIKNNLVLLDKDVLDCIQHSSKSKIYVAMVLDTLYIDIPSANSTNHIDGLTFVDTPGYNNSDATNIENSTTDSDTSKKALSSADAIIWCIDIEAGTITQRDIDFLNEAIGDNKDASVLIVFTKMDKKPKDEIENILKRAGKTCEKSLNVRPVDIIACSCLGKGTTAVSFRPKRNGSQISSVTLANIIDKLKKDMPPAKGFNYWQNLLHSYFDSILCNIDKKVSEFEEERQRLIDLKDECFMSTNSDKEYKEYLLKHLDDALSSYYEDDSKKYLMDGVENIFQEHTKSDNDQEVIQKEFKETVESIKLLKKFKNLVGQEKINSSLLLKSCYDNAVHELKRINAHLEGIQQNGENDIFAAIASDNIEKFLNCFSNGVDLSACNKQGFSPLTYIARCSNNTMMKFLINQDIDLTMKDKRGYNALETAAIYHCRDICEILIDNDKSIVDVSQPLAELAKNDKFERWITTKF